MTNEILREGLMEFEEVLRNDGKEQLSRRCFSVNGAIHWNSLRREN